MREHGLQAPQRAGHPHGPKAHDGTILTDRPDEMWGTDMTTTVTTEEGQVCVFVAVDHCTGECVGIHAAKSGNRFEALEPIRQGVREQFGGFDRDVASGLAIRHDHGSAYMSDDFQRELGFLGMTSSPSFVREPEGNGVAERFIRTLKENLLWVEHFATVAESIAALRVFKRRYNEQWLIERHGYRTPAQARADKLQGHVPREPGRLVSRSGERGTEGDSYSRSSRTRHRLEPSDARPARSSDRRSSRSPAVLPQALA
jgi:transposase InsO family protein